MHDARMDSDVAYRYLRYLEISQVEIPAYSRNISHARGPWENVVEKIDREETRDTQIFSRNNARITRRSHDAVNLQRLSSRAINSAESKSLQIPLCNPYPRESKNNS